MNAEQSLIEIEYFYEGLLHGRSRNAIALSGVHIEDCPGEYVAMSGPSGQRRVHFVVDHRPAQ